MPRGKLLDVFLSEERTRTFNLVLQRHLLCQLSYLARWRQYYISFRARLKIELLSILIHAMHTYANGLVKRHDEGNAVIRLQQVAHDSAGFVQ